MGFHPRPPFKPKLWSRPWHRGFRSAPTAKGTREGIAAFPQFLNDRSLSGDDVRQQAEETGALDRLGEFALLLLGNGRDAGRNDLAALGNVALQGGRPSR